MNLCEPHWLRAAQAGDERAFAALVAPYRAGLQAHCRRLLGSSHDAEDAIQETLLRAWRALPRFENRAPFRAWLYRIATNCAMTIAGGRSTPTVPIEETPDSPELSPPTPEASAERREVVELALLAAHEQLPSRQRAVLILREALGFSAGEVAKSLDTTPTAVHSALQRARASVDARPPGPADALVRRRVRRYADAWAVADVDGLVAMLVADAA
jgi:RNA polymerase sigma factor (sigma-70 family)